MVIQKYLLRTWEICIQIYLDSAKYIHFLESEVNSEKKIVTKYDQVLTRDSPTNMKDNRSPEKLVSPTCSKAVYITYSLIIIHCN